MSDQTAQEPTMEEILASIRRIISEDDQPQAEAQAEPQAAPQAAPEPEPEPEAPAPADEDVLELTDDMRQPEPVETVGDLDVYTPQAAPEPEPEPEPMASFDPEPEPYSPPPRAPADGLVGREASAAAASAFGSLTAALAMPRDGRTLEDVTRELLKPLLKQWLDENLPRIVEAAVQEEVARIARGRG